MHHFGGIYLSSPSGNNSWECGRSTRSFSEDFRCHGSQVSNFASRLKTLLKLVEHLHDEKKEAPSTSSASGKDGKDDKNKSNANISHEKEGEKDAVSLSAKKSSKRKLL